MHDDFAKRRQRRLEPAPNPHGELLAGRIFQARHIVQAMVVDLRKNRCERGFYVGEVHDPARRFVRNARDVNLDAKRVPMEARAFVARWHMRQAMRRFDLEDFKNVHI